MKPMPMPAPAKPAAARPIPTNAAATLSIHDSPFAPPLVRFLRVPVKVDGIPEIDTGQNGKDVRLNKCDADLQYRDRDGKGEREPADQQRQRERHTEQHGQYRVA